MINVFKLGGDWKSKDGTEYTVKTINSHERLKFIGKGWYASLDDAKAIPHEPQANKLDNDGDEPMSDYEAELRDKIKSLGGRAGGRSKIETLEKQLAELQAKDE